MQTLKTAAIVVLLMTVIYGAYVSLTTPPEPLPSQVEEMLVMSDDGTLAIDSALPPSLGELGINDGSSSTNPDSPEAGETSTASLSAPEASGSSSGYSASVSDSAGEPEVRDEDLRPAAMDGTPAMPASYSLSDSGSTQNSAQSAGEDYPNTNHSLELPDPATVAAVKGGWPNQAEVAQVNAVSDSAGPVPPVEVAKSGATANVGLANALLVADRQYAKDRRKEALSTLSLFYNAPSLSGEERSELVSRLDPLAAEVIYSRRHLLESAHRVGQNETLMEIAREYEVPWQLLANINQIQDPVTVLPGTELKVVRGPFRAEVNLTLKELTLFLGDLYAGRFPIDIGNDPAPKPGTFTVQDKRDSRTFYDAAGSPVPPGDPDNPYGSAWLDLGGQLSIHGSPNTTIPTDKGCISLADDYARDLYGILSPGSSVAIRK